MPGRALLVANPAEIEALVAAIATRQDLEAVPCSRGSQVLAALSARPPDVALIRLRLADVDGLDVLHRLRAVAPPARALLLLDEREAGHREACFRSGCEDVLFAPFVPDEVVRQLAGGDEFRFRREPRVPLGTRASLLIGGVTKEVVAESLSELGLRLRWSDAPPARAIVPITVELAAGESMSCWVRLEDVASRKGTPDALMARFVGLTGADRATVRAALDRLRGVRAGPLEAPSGVPVTFDLAARAPGEVTAFRPLPGAHAPAPARRRFANLFLAVAAIVALGTSARAWLAIDSANHPERHYEANPERIVDGLRVRRVNRMGPRVVAMADASWWDLSGDARGRAVTTLARDLPLEREHVLEVWTVRGRVAAATLDSSGAIQVAQDRR